MSTENVDRLKTVYTAWHGSRGGTPADWLALCHDNIRQNSPAIHGDEDFRVGKGAVGDYLRSLADEWEDILVEVDDYIGDGDKAVVLSHVTCRHRRTGKILSSRKIDIYRFENGLAVECIECVDTAAVQAARTA